MGDKQTSRKEVLPAFAAVVIGAVVLYLIMEAIAPMIEKNNYIYSFGDLLGGCMQGSIFYRVMWFFADLTEGSFMVSLIGTILMCMVAPIAAYLERKKSANAGTGVDGNGKSFNAMFISAFVSIIIAQILYGMWFADYGWLPTFSALLVSQTMITTYGQNMKKVLTSIVIGAVVPCPICFLIMVYITGPLGLPGFISVSLGLIVAIPLIHAIVKRLPWMMEKDIESQQEINGDSEEKKEVQPYNPSKFFIHRVFGDIGEMVIWGSSWAIIAMYVGSLITWYLNPLHGVYGANNLPLFILAQICTAALSVFIYYPTWKESGWAFTFPGIVFVSAIINTYSNSWVVVIPSIIIGAVVYPPLVQWILKKFKFDGSYPAIGLIQLSISLVCIPWSFIVLHLIMPML